MAQIKKYILYIQHLFLDSKKHSIKQLYLILLLLATDNIYMV